MVPLYLSIQIPSEEETYLSIPNTVEPVLKDYPIGHTNVVFQDRWSLATVSITLKCRTFCQEYVGLSRYLYLKTGFTVYYTMDRLYRSFLALLDYVSRAHEIKIRPSSVVCRPSSVVCRPSVRPSVASIISEVIAWISFKF